MIPKVRSTLAATFGLWFHRSRDGLPARAAWILAMVALGILSSGTLAWLLYGDIGPAAWTSVRELRSAAAKNAPWILLSSVAAAPSLLLTWWWRTVHKDEDVALAKRAERNTRFVDAVKLLAEDTMEARLGGIYSLQSLALDSPADAGRNVNTLCAFARSRSLPENLSAFARSGSLLEGQSCRNGLLSAEVEPSESAFRVPVDVQAAVSVLGAVVAWDTKVDLRRATLRGLELKDPLLFSASFQHADMRGAMCSDGAFGFASFDEANLSEAAFFYSDLARATFRKATLIGTKFLGANLENADLSDANLTNADLTQANLRFADLSRANLTGANLHGANLADADLTGAKLVGANLDSACLLSTRGIVLADLDGASYSDNTYLPSDFDPIARGMKKKDVV